MSEQNSDEQPVALVTGATSGIGAACAAGLAAAGFKIVATSHNSSLDETVRRVEAAGSEALPLSLDVRNQENIEQCFADAIARFGHVDLLVNNAGVPTPRKPIVETTRADWDEIVDINLTGAFFVAQQCALRLI